MKKIFNPSFTLPTHFFKKLATFLEKYDYMFLIIVLSSISIMSFLVYWQNGLGLAYNDARSHLDIGRRVVEGLKPGIAQLGSVWLPLPHILMIPTIWNDFMWHTGLAGALQSMISFLVTGVVIYYFLKQLGVGILGRIVALFVFVANINILYLQSTAMTELLLMAIMTLGVYELVLWHKYDKVMNLIKASFWIMLATVTRYDGWFLLFVSTILVAIHVAKKKGIKASEGYTFFFLTVASLGIVLWLLWNLLIFKDALYFAFGPYSAHAQQDQLASAGVLATKGNLFLSAKIYLYALAYNSGAMTLMMGMIGAFVLWFDRSLRKEVRIAAIALLAPLFFNIIALYMGHSVLFVQGLSGNTWFNVRYGVMMVPSLAIFIGYFVHKSQKYRYLIIGLLLLLAFFTFNGQDAVTIDDARVGSSQKNVSEVSGWLNQHAKNTPGFILISAASHDAIIFSSGLPMTKFIHEGTGTYWKAATTSPDRWAHWIVMRTNDDNDLTFHSIKKTVGFQRYTKVASYPFADIYELKPEYVSQLQTKAVLPKQR